MTPPELAAKLEMSPKVLRSWLRRTFPRSSGELNSRWILTEEQVAAAVRHFGGQKDQHDPPIRDSSIARSKRSSRSRAHSDEAYVIDLCDEILREKAMRGHRFSWLIGDPGRNGQCASLPVDAYFEKHKLVVEYRERQHYETVAFFDRRETVSGIGRGEQRRLYDQRREVIIPKHDLRLCIIRPENLKADRRLRLLRDRKYDVKAVREILRPFA